MRHKKKGNRMDRKQSENAAVKGFRYLRERGLQEFTAHAVEKVQDGRFDYNRWILKQKISSVQSGYQKKLLFARMPRVFVLVAEADKGVQAADSARLLQETIRSVRASTYSKVHLVQALHSQIRDEDFLAFVRRGDLVEKNAFFEMVQAVQDGADAVYTDEDSRAVEGGGILYRDPLFKPDYNPDYLRSCNYIGRLFMVRVGIIRSFYRDGQHDRIPTSQNLADPSEYYSLVLRCTRKAASEGGVRHVPRVLCHVYRTEERQKDCPSDQERMRRSLEEDLEERGYKGSVEDGPLPETFHVAYSIEGEPLVSIVIPSMDNASVLENCILSIRSRSTWKNYEIVVVENNSTQRQTFELYQRLEERGEARIVRYPYAFHFSRVINEGVRKAEGEYIILMNNDVTVSSPDWIERLLAQVSRPEVGAAGPKLLYPDGRVQSAGIVTGIMGFAGSMMVAEDGEDPGYMGRACLTQDMSAVTAACMMVRRGAFLEAGLFPDEFSIALGDVDFCLSLGEAGYRVVFEPAAVMIHHESLTRGAEDSRQKKKRFAAEKDRFRKKRARILKEGDPAYNPNLSRRRCDWSQQT